MRSRNENFICDIYDGTIYKNILKTEDGKLQRFCFVQQENKNITIIKGQQITNSRAFTLSMNTDGISLSEKSDLSIWPVILVINELPIEIRFCIENVIIAGTKRSVPLLNQCINFQFNFSKFKICQFRIKSQILLFYFEALLTN
jgi:hypothetical protein